LGNENSNRRSFIRKLAAAGGVGAAGLVLQSELLKDASAAGLAGQIAFYTAPNTLNGDNNLFWNNTDKRLGVGTTGPARAVHLQGNNACFRMDRDANSSAFILVRTAAGDFSTIWKTFYVGVDASGVNDGSFFIGDVGTAVSGPSTKRLVIDNAGCVGIGTSSPLYNIDVGPTYGFAYIRTNRPSNLVAGGLILSTAGTNKWSVLLPYTGTDDLLIYNESLYSAAMVFNLGNNNVGIGTTTPQSRLHVVGNDVRFGVSNFIAGNSGNSVTTGVVGATISGGGAGGGINRVTDDYGTVGGGYYNQAGDNAGVTSDRPYATVAGGYYNRASGEYATVGGGYNNTADLMYCTVSGGHSNTAGDGGGFYSTVGGGISNTASSNRATVGGGDHNTASGDYATVGGGYYNTASGERSTVAGGSTNTASGIDATVPGGSSSVAAGNYSFAAGTKAKANHQGAFVWGDSTNADFASSANDQFNVRAAGGTRIFSNSGASVGVQLAAGGNSWSAICDRNLKENFMAVDGRDVLERLSRIPITQWNLKSQDPSIQHMGPMAQDFYAAFGLGGMIGISAPWTLKV